MRVPTNYAGPRRKTPEKKKVSQSTSSNMAKGAATVADVLESKGNAIFSIKREDTLQAAVDVLGEKRIGALLVLTDDGRLEGIVSERDIVRNLAGVPGDVLTKPVSAFMTTKVKSCSPGDSLLKVLKIMTEGRFRHMPVMENDNLLGMVTIGDVVHHRLGELELEAVKMKQMIVG
ncbi:MAG: CBS domain-containing protein [Pseudomonadota bacterium]